MWYNHFPNQLMQPYGKIEAALTNKKIKEKLNPKSVNGLLDQR